MHNIEELKNQLKELKHGEVKYKAQVIDNGIQITITSENPEAVTKLKEWATRAEAGHSNHEQHNHEK
jgi:TusA-related sulfurtransferase